MKTNRVRTAGRGKRLAALVAVLLVSAAGGSPAFADAYGRATPLSDEVLAGQRGGFLTADGLVLGFGADMKTLVDGQLALETVVNWTSQGAATQQIGPNGVPIALPAGAVSSAVLSDPTGTIRLMQTLSSQAFANVVLNTASNHAVTQTTDVTLTLPGFGATQQSYQQTQVGLALAQQLGMALTRMH